jgi:hypothetical protein
MTDSRCPYCHTGWTLRSRARPAGRDTTWTAGRSTAGAPSTGASARRPTSPWRRPRPATARAVGITRLGPGDFTARLGNSGPGTCPAAGRDSTDDPGTDPSTGLGTSTRPGQVPAQAPASAPVWVPQPPSAPAAPPRPGPCGYLPHRAARSLGQRARQPHRPTHRRQPGTPPRPIGKRRTCEPATPPARGRPPRAHDRVRGTPLRARRGRGRRATRPLPRVLPRLGPAPHPDQRAAARQPAPRRHPAASGYPREKPYCTTAAPIFHPNFGAYVCIADLWTPDRSLVDVVVQIGDMIQFKLFNTGSPLDAVAARWAAENLDLVPVGTADLYPIEADVALAARTELPVNGTPPPPSTRTRPSSGRPHRDHPRRPRHPGGRAAGPRSRRPPNPQLIRSVARPRLRRRGPGGAATCRRARSPVSSAASPASRSPRCHGRGRG